MAVREGLTSQTAKTDRFANLVLDYNAPPSLAQLKLDMASLDLSNRNKAVIVRGASQDVVTAFNTEQSPAAQLVFQTRLADREGSLFVMFQDSPCPHLHPNRQGYGEIYSSQVAAVVTRPDSGERYVVLIRDRSRPKFMTPGGTAGEAEVANGPDGAVVDHEAVARREWQEEMSVRVGGHLRPAPPLGALIQVLDTDYATTLHGVPVANDHSRCFACTLPWPEAGTADALAALFAEPVRQEDGTFRLSVENLEIDTLLAVPLPEALVPLAVRRDYAAIVALKPAGASMTHGSWLAAALALAPRAAAEPAVEVSDAAELARLGFPASVKRMVL